MESAIDNNSYKMLSVSKDEAEGEGDVFQSLYNINVPFDAKHPV